MFFRKIKNYFPSAKLVSDGKEILIRCRFCPDSDNPNHAHMYISNDNMLQYHCKKCGSHGRITKSKLISWGVTDYEILKNIKSCDGNYVSNKIYNVRNMITTNSYNNLDLAKDKLQYINNRLGTNLDFNDIDSNKIILNINDFMANNYINKQANFLNYNFVGFLSYDNSSINLRDISGKSKYRYYNYNIFDNETSGSFYLLPTDIDILKPTNVHLSEGPFDILGIKYNLQHRLDQNNIFISCRGISYKSILIFILTELGIINPIFHIYLDNGVPDYVTNNIISLLSNISCSIYFHNNIYENEKDFGVPRDRIILNSIKIR